MKNWLFKGILILSAGGAVALQADETPMTTVGATQNIEYLQRWYARATDLIGTNDPSNIEEGRAIYHRIFTPDVRISASDPGANREFAAQGPDRWVDVVAGAGTASSYDCEYCPKGKHQPDTHADSKARTACAGCAAGQYKSSKYYSKCYTCPFGKYAASVASEACTACDAGKFTSTDRTNCEKFGGCQKGSYPLVSYYTKQVSGCRKCPGGKFSSEGQACVSCAAGKVSDAGASECTDCPLGKYMRYSYCNSCPYGRYNEQPGSTTALDCKYCPLGKHYQYHSSGAKAGTSECHLCPSGYYGSNHHASVIQIALRRGSCQTLRPSAVPS